MVVAAVVVVVAVAAVVAAVVVVAVAAVVAVVAAVVVAVDHLPSNSPRLHRPVPQFRPRPQPPHQYPCHLPHSRPQRQQRHRV